MVIRLKRDLTKLGSFLMMGLIGIIIASIVNIFMKSSMMYFVISILGVLILLVLLPTIHKKLKICMPLVIRVKSWAKKR